MQVIFDDKSSKDFFVRLLRRMIFDVGIRAVAFSQNPPGMSGASQADIPRIDMVLSGEKHMLYPTDGRIEDICLPAGTVHYSPPLTPKLPIWDHVHEMSGIVFCHNFIRITYINIESPLFQKEIEAPVWYHTSSPMNNEIRSLCDVLNLLAKHVSAYESDVLLMDALLRLVLKELENDTSYKCGKKQLTWRRAVSYLHENFTVPISRAGMAKYLQISPGYLSQLFMDESGENFVSYLRRMRMEYAVKLLMGTNDSIDEITDQCGYLSSTFFISAFHRYYGMPPGQYRSRRKSSDIPLPT